MENQYLLTPYAFSIINDLQGEFMIPDILIILFTILNSIKIKGYHQFERKIDKCRMQVASFKTNSKTHHRIKSKYYD